LGVEARLNPIAAAVAWNWAIWTVLSSIHGPRRGELNKVNGTKYLRYFPFVAYSLTYRF
jgi:hypothetical protein